MTSGLDEPSDLGRQWADSASFYSMRGSAMAASAFAITASARSIAARNSSLFQVSTEWPSSNDSSVASCARETNSRSAAMASASSLASVPFREDCVTSITPSHRNSGPPCNIVTKDDNCNCRRSHVRRLPRVWLCSSVGSGGSRGAPVPRQKLVEAVDGMSVDHALQHIAQVCVRLDVVEFARFDERIEDGPSFPTAITSGEKMVLAAERHGCHRNNMLVTMLWRRQTSAAVAPGSSDSVTIASFSSSLKRRRLARSSLGGSAVGASVKRLLARDPLAALLTLVLISGRALG